MRNEKYYSELASCLLLEENIKTLQSRVKISTSVLMQWSETDIHSKSLWKRILIEYTKRLDMQKMMEFEEKYNIFLTKAITEKDISMILKMPLKKVVSFRKSKNFKKDIYELLMKQDKNILQFHINTILFKLNYKGLI